MALTASLRHPNRIAPKNFGPKLTQYIWDEAFIFGVSVVKSGSLRLAKAIWFFLAKYSIVV
ncbi:hypothetical protein IQ273_14800 [Nodosilinea sp. LEGE 07298]|nr:hypothetical protein [Nodosilinea sp. LEGE 07298]